jgi:hypothetical protein
MEIINSEARVSAPFVIEKGQQVTLFASGLANTDQVVIEVLTLTTSGPAGDLCCPGPVALPEVVGAVPLTCRNGTVVKMTAKLPWVILGAPQGVQLRARVVTPDSDAVISVHMTPSDSEGCMTCACDEAEIDKICASYPMFGGGFGFIAGDVTDPEATVTMTACDGKAPAIKLYPTPRPGANTPQYDCNGAVIGYAMNRSNCAPVPFDAPQVIVQPAAPFVIRDIFESCAAPAAATPFKCQ